MPSLEGTSIEIVFQSFERAIAQVSAFDVDLNFIRPEKAKEAKK